MYIVHPASNAISFGTKLKGIKMGLKQIDHGSKEYTQMIQLRQAILRDPIGLQFSQEELDEEKDHILIAAYEDDDMLGCCMLKKVDNHTLQLRQMAVKDNLQRKGIGASIMSFAENLSRDKGYKKIIMHARDSAIGFYERCGYKKKGDQFIEINLPHHVMEKKL
jgi:N-acetylglutamate synthase-like GNAT family acetyltransferase